MLAKKIIAASEAGLFLNEIPTSALITENFELYALCEDAPKIEEVQRNIQVGTLLLPPQDAVDQLLKMNADDLQIKQEQTRAALADWQKQMDEYLNQVEKAKVARSLILFSEK